MSADQLADEDYLPNRPTPENYDPADPETWEPVDEAIHARFDAERERDRDAHGRDWFENDEGWA